MALTLPVPVGAHLHQASVVPWIHPTMPRQPPRNRLTDRRLWDEAGIEWRWVTDQLGKDATVALLKRADVRACLQTDWGQPLQWLSTSNKWSVWQTEVEPRWYETLPEDDKRRPYESSLWESGPRQLLLLQSD